MGMSSIHELLEHGLKDAFSAESQITKALPKMKKGCESEELQEAIEMHLEETRGQLERLNQIGEQLGMKLKGKRCAAMEGLVEEGQEVLEEGEMGMVMDNAIIAALQKVEHYEIAAYGTLRTLAQKLGEDDVAELLQQTLDEEKAADEKLTEIALGLQDESNEDLADSAREAGEEEMSDEGSEAEPATRGSRASQTHGRAGGTGATGRSGGKASGSKGQGGARGGTSRPR